MKQTQWIVGVDLRKRSDGAVRFATWLKGLFQDPAQAPALRGVHVLEDAQVNALRKHGSRAEIRGRLEAEAQLVVTRAGAEGALASLEVAESRRAEDGLTSECQEHGADALIIGRKSGVDEAAVVRLGTVARRLLRTLPAPVIVVPPDLESAAFGSGPIVLAAVPGDSSVGALRFAAALARQTGRGFVVTHVVRVPLDYAQLYWSDAEVEKVHEEHRAAAFRRLKEWLVTHGAEGARVDLRSGLEFDALADACAEHRAALLVTGTRRLTNLERLALLSVSSDLAGHARLPVAVIPPDYGG